MTADSHDVPFKGKENILKLDLDLVMVIQPCEYTKHH